MARVKAKAFEKSGECILGDGDFVEKALAAAQEEMEKRCRLSSRGYDLDTIASRVCDIRGLETRSLRASGKERKRVESRSVLCYWAARDLGTSMGGSCSIGTAMNKDSKGNFHRDYAIDMGQEAGFRFKA